MVKESVKLPSLKKPLFILNGDKQWWLVINGEGRRVTGDKIHPLFYSDFCLSLLTLTLFELRLFQSEIKKSKYSDDNLFFLWPSRHYSFEHRHNLRSKGPAFIQRPLVYDRSKGALKASLRPP